MLHSYLRPQKNLSQVGILLRRYLLPSLSSLFLICRQNDRTTGQEVFDEPNAVPHSLLLQADTSDVEELFNSSGVRCGEDQGPSQPLVIDPSSFHSFMGTSTVNLATVMGSRNSTFAFAPSELSAAWLGDHSKILTPGDVFSDVAKNPIRAKACGDVLSQCTTPHNNEKSHTIET